MKEFLRWVIVTVLTVVSLAKVVSGVVLAGVPAYLQRHESDEPLVPAEPPVIRPDVYELKTRLRDLGLYAGPIDEVYDKEAQEAVRALQKRYWLPADGVVDESTWRALARGVRRPEVAVVGPPPSGTVRLEIDTAKAELSVYVDDKLWKVYPVAVGRWESLTPVGEWKVIDKGYETGGAFGSRWMALDVPWGGYGIHGTNRPWSIGSHASLGCVRLFNEDIEELFDIVQIGTRVTIKGIEPYLRFDKPLGPGSVGPEVVKLQSSLRNLGFNPGYCDGRYGPVTARMVEEVNVLFGLGTSPSAGLDLFALVGLRSR